MARQQETKRKKLVEASLSKGVENIPKKSISGKYSEKEMLTRLKLLAMNPCNPQLARDNIQPLQNQILRVRKVMVLKNSQTPPLRKRKLEKLVKDNLSDASSFLVPNKQNSKKATKTEVPSSPSMSCLHNSSKCHYKKTHDSRITSSSLTFDGTFMENHALLVHDMVNKDNPENDISPIVDSDESTNEPNAWSSKNVSPNAVLSQENNDANCYLKLDNKPERRNFKSCKQDFLDDHVQTNVIPIGPRFQANVPEWRDSVNKYFLMDAYNSDLDNSKWLGTQTWPIENGDRNTSRRTIGNGRPDSCYCVSIGSVACVRRHILEKRLLLQCDLGPAFFSWKFDEMGEQVSKLWTLKEREAFESLMKRPSCKGNFLKHALEYIPNKSRSEVICYYFNVYIPHRVSMKARLPSPEQVDTDDEDKEEEDDNKDMGLRKKFGDRSFIHTNSKDVKTRLMW